MPYFQKRLYSITLAQIVTRKTRKSKQQQLSRNQGPEMPFQHTLGKTFIFGGRVLKLINSGQTEGEKDTEKAVRKTSF